MELVFLVPSRPFPVGGILSIYSFAHALLDRGHGVRLVHVDDDGGAPTRPEDLGHLVTFDPRVDHDVIETYTGQAVGGDAVFCFDERLPADADLPVMWVQAAAVIAWEREAAIFGADCPKVCTSSWLQHVARALGNADDQTVVATYGVDTDRFRPTRPFAERDRRVIMLHHPHPAKGARLGLRALRAARRALPDLEATLFGTSPPPDDLPVWIDYLHDPPQAELASIYGAHRGFLMPSRVEGFGITGIEAQACGTPLLVTANGGSADYAHPGIDALVAAPDDIDTMAAHIVSVVTDDALAERLSTAGRATAEGFTWARSAEVIDDLLTRYAADPEPLRRPVSVPANPEEAGLGLDRMLADFYARA